MNVSLLILVLATVSATLDKPALRSFFGIVIVFPPEIIPTKLPRMISSEQATQLHQWALLDEPEFITRSKNLISDTNTYFWDHMIFGRQVKRNMQELRSQGLSEDECIIALGRRFHEALKTMVVQHDILDDTVHEYK